MVIVIILLVIAAETNFAGKSRGIIGPEMSIRNRLASCQFNLCVSLTTPNYSKKGFSEKATACDLFWFSSALFQDWEFERFRGVWVFKIGTDYLYFLALLAGMVYATFWDVENVKNQP
ncbi:hypothetical protein AVEN_247117-1 [Araneus ventricosus]|uniref:Uncharacterized protein n=1 Tax=Araneus ventricosus TaxID=182803 RepID=A0A4Y2FTX6_ARAVE|nr:hypothetical protein AVEN_247117-1 [Araneus ventricosus]